jgi:2-polyprenyl-6-methoxyphenol hydroxylase-like FAD-dependent oxidoreductase
MLDVRALVTALASHQGNVNDALAQYEARRLPEIRALMRFVSVRSYMHSSLLPAACASIVRLLALICGYLLNLLTDR